MPRKSPYVLELTAEQRRKLEARARRYRLPYRDVIRAKIVFLAAQGLDNDEIAARLDTRRDRVEVARALLRAGSGRAGGTPTGWPAGGLSP